ncbi:MAG: SprB repeat-containing protein, partial [Saprospiraceae bacterium]|nr:SprB repeat-containing protein [Saprospiraceae bacterium]
MLPIEKQLYGISTPSVFRFFLLLTLWSAALLTSQSGNAQTYIYDSKIIASNNPFGGLPAGTDTIVIRDTFEINTNYEPILNGNPFEGILLVEGGVLYWSSNVYLKLGSNARIFLFNGGHLYPGTNTDIGCNPAKTIWFDAFKLASCSGINALHAFSDVNAAGCFDGTGICCDAAITVAEDSGKPNDRTLCAPGDSVELSVIGSGNIDYNYTWMPNLGPGNGPFKVAQYSNTTYSISITAIFDPFGAAPPYLLTCGASATVKINPQITLIANTTPVPCASAAVGAVNLTVSGGTAPYKYLWSNGATTEDLSGLTAGAYHVTVTDAKGCTQVKTATVATFDNTPPVISCPASASGVAIANQCTTTIPGIDAVFSDNCPAAQLTYQISGASTADGAGQLSNSFPFQVGVNNVTYRVSDGTNQV